MFDVAPEYLQEAMERFSALFVSPLFTQSATGREVQAVHNEFAKNLNTDDRRINQVLRSWVRPEHPLSQFGTGNLDTLRLGSDGDSSLLSSYLAAFHAQHYHARSMRLVVLGRESLDTLEQWARDFFVAVPDNPPPDALLAKTQRLQRPVFEVRGHGLSPLGQQIDIVPVRDSRQLLLRWPLAKNEEQFREYGSHRVVSHFLGNYVIEKAEKFLVASIYSLFSLSLSSLSFFIFFSSSQFCCLSGHEGPKSLLSYLKEKGWASAVSAGTDWSVEYFYTFMVDISLTQEGLANIDEIVAAVFYYLGMISHSDDRVLARAFAEMKQLHDIKFRFRV